MKCAAETFNSAMKAHSSSYSRKNQVFNGEHSLITVMAVRTGVLLYMIAVTVLFGWGTFSMLSLYELRLNEVEYSGFADDLGKSSIQSLDRTFQVTKLMASITAKACPDAAIWPNCSGISVPDYVDYIDSFVAINPQVRSIALNPFIRDAQIASFEAFAYEFYDEQGHGPNSSLPFGINSDFGKGIAARDSNGVLFHMNESYDLGEHRLLAPILMQGKLESNLGSLMFNVYSETARVRGIDDMLACVNASAPEDAVDCGAITDFIRLVQDAFSAVRPAALLYFPIFPTNDPTTLVGASFSVFNWDVVLSGHLGSNVGSVLAVLTTGLQTFTFKVTNADVEVIGEGDFHDSKFNKFRKKFSLTSHEFSIFEYTLFVYPTEEFTYDSNFPVLGCVLAVCVILVTSLVVFFYDLVVSKDSRERELIGETKRLFVRYVSHEIRTPLNTVHLGLVFLHSDIGRMLTSLNGMVPSVVYEEMNSWVGLVEEIEDSADIAVTVLNDLINYDKIVVGSLNVELSTVSILECVRNTVRPFQVQARERNISLRVKAQNVRFLETLVCVVDIVKIEQVIRNLICNALKFTPLDGEVTVSVSVHKGDVDDWLPTEELSVGSKPDTNSVDYHSLDFFGTICIDVKDSGVGMTEQNLAMLFQEGVQFNANQLQDGKGSGLGLWVSKGFAQRHHGDIRAASAGLGLGSTFTLELPCYLPRVLASTNRDNGNDFALERGDRLTLSSGNSNNNSGSPYIPLDSNAGGSQDSYDVEAVDSPRIDQADCIILSAPSQEAGDSGVDEFVTLDKLASQGADPTSHDIKTSEVFKNILVIDDSIPNRKILCRLLANGGFICTQAENGKIGLDLVTGDMSMFDMILMDFEMPVMDGPTATKAIRAAGYTRPIVGITGNVLESDRGIFLNAGANEVLYKPLTLKPFNDCLEMLSKKIIK